MKRGRNGSKEERFFLSSLQLSLLYILSSFAPDLFSHLLCKDPTRKHGSNRSKDEQQTILKLIKTSFGTERVHRCSLEQQL